MPGKHKNRRRPSTAGPHRRRGQRLSEQERCQIITLYQKACWSQRAIATKLQIAYSTVHDCILLGITTPTKQAGPRLILTTQKRRRLVNRATSDHLHRRMSFSEIANLDGLRAYSRTLTAAFAKEDYHRRIAVAKPYLNTA